MLLGKVKIQGCPKTTRMDCVVHSNGQFVTLRAELSYSYEDSEYTMSLCSVEEPRPDKTPREKVEVDPELIPPAYRKKPHPKKSFVPDAEIDEPFDRRDPPMIDEDDLA